MNEALHEVFVLKTPFQTAGQLSRTLNQTASPELKSEILSPDLRAYFGWGPEVRQHTISLLKKAHYNPINT